MSDPEILIGSGKSQITLKGREAIRAAGWTVRFLLFARGIRLLFLLGGFSLFLYAAVQWCRPVVQWLYAVAQWWLSP
jgi:hypothetical protein